MSHPKLTKLTPLALLATAALATACGAGNELPPVPVPKPTEEAELPRWYPEAPWTAAGGQSRVFIEGKIVFDPGRALIRPGSEKVLDTLLKFMKEHPEVTQLRVEGHTDAAEPPAEAYKISADRALAVCDWLVDHGVENTRLLAIGFGSSRPLGPNERADGRQENRRTEFHVAEVNGKAFITEKGTKDPTAGGNLLAVKSAEERRKEKELAASLRIKVKPEPFVAKGNEVHVVVPEAAEADAPKGDKKNPKPDAKPEPKKDGS